MPDTAGPKGGIFFNSSQRGIGPESATLVNQSSPRTRGARSKHRLSPTRGWGRPVREEDEAELQRAVDLANVQWMVKDAGREKCLFLAMIEECFHITVTWAATTVHTVVCRENISVETATLCGTLCFHSLLVPLLPLTKRFLCRSPL